MHFQEHHAGLAVTIAAVLRSEGVALLCQPPRGKSLARFINVLDSMVDDDDKPLFHVELLKEYNEQVTRVHQESLKQDGDIYDPDIHYPRLLILKKLRHLQDEDRARAVQCVKDR